MTKRPCPNSTKTKALTLKRFRYGDDDFDSYYLPSSEVDRLSGEGKIPLIEAAGFEQANRPRIALILAQDKSPERDIPDYSMHPDYVDAVVKAGGYPIFISYDQVIEQLEAWQPQGILLIGGDFAFKPEWFVQGDAPTAQGSRRAEAYVEMCDYAKTHHLPTLGICGGEQILGGYNGALLRHHINARQPEINHRQGGYVLAHEILITPNSLLADIIGTAPILTNSCHHEAVRADFSGDCLMTATAADGIVEALEYRQPWHRFVLGVQWHPERLVKRGDTTQLKIFERFIEEATHVQR